MDQHRSVLLISVVHNTDGKMDILKYTSGEDGEKMSLSEAKGLFSVL